MDMLILAIGSQPALVAGNFRIFGSPGSSDTVTLAPSELGSLSVIFDPSFNEGLDRIVIVGSPSDFTVTRSGSSIVLSIVLSDGDALTATIPVGIEGVELSFVSPDGPESQVFDLRFDEATQTVFIGDQAVEIGESIPLQGSNAAPGILGSNNDALLAMFEIGPNGGNQIEDQVMGIGPIDQAGGADPLATLPLDPRVPGLGLEAFELAVVL